MSLIRKIKITNFRGLNHFEWRPSPGINCLIGSGDSGKSSILDAIDLCLGARRNIQVTDADFHLLNIDTPIMITITLGDLGDGLKQFDTYGLYLRGFDPHTGDVADEPEAGLETVLTVQLIVEGDLEPQWSLISDRAIAQNQTRNLIWADRVRLAPTRLGAIAEHNFSWRRDSVLNKISEERVDASAALVKAARHARASFGEEAKDQLNESLGKVIETAKFLGIPVGKEVKAMLDTHSVSFKDGMISLHDEAGVPLKGLGLGSTRLLIVGLQRCVAAKSSMILIDEMEYGLEPHRIIRLLDTLGAKEKTPPLQVFMTTHSPVAVKELSGDQLFVVRYQTGHNEIRAVGSSNDVQGTIRLYPDALLAPAVMVCEGASEVGLLRGLDQYRISQGEPSITACGVAIVDGGGSSAFKRAVAFQSLGYRTAVFRDSDVCLTPELETIFREAGGTVVAWRDGCALEDEIFDSLTNTGIDVLIKLAIEIREESIINDNIKSASSNKLDLKKIQTELLIGDISPGTRAILGKAAKSKKGWFKTVSDMETIARDVVGPDLPNAGASLKAVIKEIFEWTANGR
jgi:hypothetical protein